MYVIEPVKNGIVDIKYLKNKVKKYIDSRIDYYTENNTNLFLESQFTEYWIKGATNGTDISKGNSPIDVISETNDAIDVFNVCLNSNTTNEKSLMQNFKTCGNLLDVYFDSGNDKKAVDLFPNMNVKLIK